MNVINVNIPGHGYPVYVEDGLLDMAGKLVADLNIKGRIAVISDENVFALYGERLRRSIENAGLSCRFRCLAPGENQKCRGDGVIDTHP